MRISQYILFVNMLFISVQAQNAWTKISNGLPNGQVYSLCRQGSTLYAGLYSLGVYKSTDQGLNWTATANHPKFNSIHVWSMEVIDTCIFAGMRGSGVIRSTDGGASWTQLLNGLGNKFVQDLQAIGKELYAGTYGGYVYSSKDLGEHWTRVLNGFGMNDSNVYSLATDGKFVYSGTAGINTSADTGVIFRMDLNNPNTWEKVNTGLGLNGVHLEQIFSIGADSTTIFAGTDDIGLYRSTNQGSSWTQVDKDNGDVIAISVFGNSVFAGHSFGGVRVSTDNGNNWKTNNQNLVNESGTLVQFVNDFLYDGIFVYAATDYGVFRRPFNSVSTNINRTVDLPKKFELSQNFPNPFNPSTNIMYRILVDEHVTVKVFDALGRVVSVLVNEPQHAGKHNVEFHASDLASGVYFYSVCIGGLVITKKLVLLR